MGHKRYQTAWYTTERITNLRPTSGPSNCRPQAVPDCMVLNGTYYKLATHKRTKRIVGHKRYQTVWYSTERTINLRPTSEPSKLWATSGTRLYGTQRNVLQTCDPQANQANCRPQAVPDCMVLNGTYYKLATHERTKQIVGRKRYQTVWYSTERIINLRPTSEPSKLWATSGTRLYGTQRNVL